MSEQYLSTTSKTGMHLKKFMFFLIFTGQKTHCRHSQGDLREGATTGCIKIVQNTFITVYEEESQKASNTKLWKRNLDFRGNKRDISLQPSRKVDFKMQKVKKKELHFNTKAYQLILQNSVARKYKHIQRTDQKIRQTNYGKDLMSPKETKVPGFFAKISSGGYEVNEKGHFPTKKPRNKSICDQIGFGI